MSEHNIVVLRGTMVGESTTRELSSGTSCCSSTSAPVIRRHRFGARGLARSARRRARPGVGTAVVVVGSVRRRFFRVAGATQSRTEVVADRVVAARRAREVRRMLGAASVLLDPASAEPVAELR